MTLRVVSRDDLDEELKRIKRAGVERLVSVTPADEGEFVVRTEPMPEPPLEIRR
jgi:hypothetical protein